MQIETRLGPLEVVVHTTGQGPVVSGAYAQYPSAGAPVGLRVLANIVPGFAEGREHGQNYPAFESTICDDVVHLRRYDAEGTVTFVDNVTVCRFTCGESANSLEAVIRIGASIALPRAGALIVHASCVADERGAHIFVGVSGAGKSTIAAMLHGAYPVAKLSDELLLLYKVEDIWQVAVAPFIGSSGLPHGERRPLASINVLRQAKRHERTLLAKRVAMGELPRHVLTYARDQKTSQCVIDLLADLVETVPCYHLRFAKDPGVGQVLEFEQTTQLGGNVGS